MEHNQSDKKFDTISDVGLAMKCPYCGNQGADFKSKASQWECRSCERRFTEADLAVNQRLSDKALNPKVIFFSYGHDDNRELVEIFKADLKKRGHEIWFDAKDIGTWDDWKGSITRGIDRSQMAIAFMSRHGLRVPDGVCRNEIALALNRFGIIYPVAMEPSPKEYVPVTISDLHWTDLSQWQDIRNGNVRGEDWDRWYEAHLIELVGKIEGEATHFADESQALREVLRPSSFESKIAQHLEGFVGRKWIFDAYSHWLNHEPQSRIFWLKAGPGVGKTALAAMCASAGRCLASIRSCMKFGQGASTQTAFWIMKS